MWENKRSIDLTDKSDLEIACIQLMKVSRGGKQYVFYPLFECRCNANDCGKGDRHSKMERSDLNDKTYKICSKNPRR